MENELTSLEDESSLIRNIKKEKVELLAERERKLEELDTWSSGTRGFVSAKPG